jgi:hypothetical protein
MLRGSRHLGKILGYSFSPIKFHLSLLGSLASHRTWRHLAATAGTSRKQGVNKPNVCSATGALAPGPDYQQQQQNKKREVARHDINLLNPTGCVMHQQV